MDSWRLRERDFLPEALSQPGPSGLLVVHPLPPWPSPPPGRLPALPFPLPWHCSPPQRVSEGGGIICASAMNSGLTGSVIHLLIFLVVHRLQHEVQKHQGLLQSPTSTSTVSFIARPSQFCLKIFSRAFTAALPRAALWHPSGLPAVLFSRLNPERQKLYGPFDICIIPARADCCA